MIGVWLSLTHWPTVQYNDTSTRPWLTHWPAVLNTMTPQHGFHWPTDLPSSVQWQLSFHWPTDLPSSIQWHLHITFTDPLTYRPQYNDASTWLSLTHWPTVLNTMTPQHDFHWPTDLPSSIQWHLNMAFTDPLTYRPQYNDTSIRPWQTPRSESEVGATVEEYRHISIYQPFVQSYQSFCSVTPI